MLMPKKNRVTIYEYLFKEGVMVAKKDYHAPKHLELETIPNLQVIKAMQVCRSIALSIFSFASPSQVLRTVVQWCSGVPILLPINMRNNT